MIKQYWQLAVAVALLLAGFAGGWYIQGNRWDADVASVRQQNAEDMKAVSDAAAKQLADERAKSQALQTQLATLDTKYTQDLANAQADNDRLRANVTTGTRKLYVKGKCPNPGSSVNVSKTATSGSLGDDSRVELSNDTGSNVLDIRAGIISDQAKLKYLQDYAAALQN